MLTVGVSNPNCEGQTPTTPAANRTPHVACLPLDAVAEVADLRVDGDEPDTRLVIFCVASEGRRDLILRAVHTVHSQLVTRQELDRLVETAARRKRGPLGIELVL